MLIGFFMLMVDSSIVSVANPSLQRDLQASLTATIWVTSAYLLGLAVPLLLAGRLGDRFGQRTIFLTGMAVFTASSAACGLAPTIGVLIAARAVQGVGGALMSPQSQAMIVRIFPPHRRGAAMGLWGSVSGIALLVGPILGGVLVQTIGWQAIFLINVPVGIVGLILASRFLPRLATSRPRFDWLGVALSGVGILAVVYALQEGVDRAWGRVWGPITIPEILVAGLVALAGFLWWQTRVEEPLLPLNLFRDRDFALGNSAIFLVGVAMTSMSLPLLYFVQVARGFNPLVSAVFMMPSAIIGGVLAPFVGSRLVAKLGAQRVAPFGLAAMAGALAWYTLYFTPTSHVWLLLIPSCLAGVGNACIWSPISMSATHHLPLARAGAGAGVYNTMRQMGSVLGSALVATWMNARIAAHGLDPSIASQRPSGTGLSGAAALGFSQAMAQTLWLPCGVALVGALVAAFFTGQAGHHRRAPVREVPPPGSSV